MGLCGNNDNTKDNDFMGETKAAMSDGQEFATFYSCSSSTYTELTSKTNDVSLFLLKKSFFDLN